MKELFDAILFAVGVTLPSVLLLGFGVVMRRTGQVDAAFAAKASRLVFNYGLPCLLFHELMSSEIHYGQEAVMLAAGVSTTLLLYLGAELYAWRFVPEVRDKGVFVQGVFRSNMAIMGLAFVQNAYGNAGLPSGAVYVGVVTLLYNVLSVIIMQTARYMANIALPMALICAGATFDVRSVLDTSGISLQASIGRLVVAPLTAVAVGLAFGLRGIPMGVLFLMCAMPVAAASYVMAKAMGGNDVAAANIVGITTFGAMFSAAIGITVLRSTGLM